MDSSTESLASTSFSRRLKSTLSKSQTRSEAYDDIRYHDEMALGGGNGVRVWYESYTTIDWIHDAIKESSRLRRIRGIKGTRGAIYNVWDRFQGWLIVTITGVLTALIAGFIVKSEAVLFDLKEGYCQRDWRLAKRFCCPYADQPDWDGRGLSFISTKGVGSGFLKGWSAPTAGSALWSKLGEGEEGCPGWTTWSEAFDHGTEDSWLADYGMYVAIAIVWASIASLLTIYLTSSELYSYKKDIRPPVAASLSTTLPGSGRSSESSSSLPSPTDERAPLVSRAHTVTDYGSSLPPKLLSQMAGQQRTEAALPSRKVLYFGSGSGISEIKCILSGFVIHGYLGFWTLFTKSVGLTLSVASGLSLGKEGPFVHIASCVGNIVCRAFHKYERNESKRREMLSCACAAGVAVAFGAPVGGVLFSLEEVSYYFPGKVMFRSFFCAMVAAATLRFLDPFGTGKIVLFQVTYDRDWHWFELAFFVLIGVFGGVYGALFTKLNMLWSKNVRAKTWMAHHPLYEVIVITIVSTALAFLNGYTRMSGPELIADLFSECHEHESLEGLCVSTPSQIKPLVAAVSWVMLTKGLLTIVTFGIKLPAGIFIPTLAVGACFGRIVGLVVQYIQWTRPELEFFSWCPASDSACIVPGVYAMVGAAASLSGVTRTTVSLVVIMFELTGTLTYAVPVMLSVLVARTVADGLEPKGIYDLVLEFSGLPYLDQKEEFTWQGVSILDAMDTGVDVIRVDKENTVEELMVKLQRLTLVNGHTDGGFPLVHQIDNRRWNLVGYIAAQELEHGLETLMATTSGEAPALIKCAFRLNLRDSSMFGSADPHDLGKYVDRAPVTVGVATPLELVHQMFVKLGVKYIIVEGEDGALRGVIFKKRWLEFLHHLQEDEK